MVLERITVPMVPQSIQEAVMMQAVQAVADAMNSKLSKGQLQKLCKAIDGVSDGISPDERQHMIDVLVVSLDSLPLIPKSAQRNIVGAIVDVIIGDASPIAMASQGIASGVVTATSLFDPAARTKLAHHLNEKVDIPGLNEEQEEAIFLKGVEMLGSVLEKIIPPEYRKSLHGCSKKEIDGLKLNLVSHLEDQVNIPLLPKEYKNKMFTGFIDYTFEFMFDATGLDNVVFSAEVKLERLDKAIADIQIELECAKRSAQRREHSIERRVGTMEAERTALQMEIRSHQHPWIIGGLSVLGISAVGCVVYSCTK